MVIKKFIILALVMVFCGESVIAASGENPAKKSNSGLPARFRRPRQTPSIASLQLQEARMRADIERELAQQKKMFEHRKSKIERASRLKSFRDEALEQATLQNMIDIKRYRNMDADDVLKIVVQINAAIKTLNDLLEKTGTLERLETFKVTPNQFNAQMTLSDIETLYEPLFEELSYGEYERRGLKYRAEAQVAIATLKKLFE